MNLDNANERPCDVCDQAWGSAAQHVCDRDLAAIAASGRMALVGIESPDGARSYELRDPKALMREADDGVKDAVTT